MNQRAVHLLRDGVALLILAALLGWQIWIRVSVTDETRVQRVLNQLTAAVEQGDLIKLENNIAGDYHDNLGLDKPSLIGAVRSFRSQYGAIFIHLSDLKITVESDHQTAQAEFLAKIFGRTKGTLADSELSENHFHLFFRKTDAGWKLTQTDSPDLKIE